MNKNSMFEPLSIDDVHYTRSIILDYVQGFLTFDQLLEVMPSDVNLAKLMVLLKRHGDKEIAIKVASLIIDHYHNKLKNAKTYDNEKLFKNLLKVNEVLFLTDAEEIEKLIEGKEINLGEEIKTAFTPFKKDLHPILIEKVLGASKSKLVMLIKPYNSLFNKENYLKNPSGYVSPNGDITIVDEKIINFVEQLTSENQLFPAKVPTEKLLFTICKKQALEEPTL